MLEKIEQYFKLEKEIHDYFGYVEDWVTIPLADERDMYWHLIERGHGGEIIYCDKPLTKEILDSGEMYSGTIYTQRFLPKWVYRGEALTLVSVDTQTDGNKFLFILDNAKEVKVLPENNSSFL